MMKQGFSALLIAAAMSMTIMGTPTQAFAQSEEEINRQVEQLSEAGGERYGEKDYEGAIELFIQAYELHPVPNLLYNVARCHEKLEQWDEAIDYYEQFIVAPDIDTDDRKSALGRIEKLREIQRAQKDIEDPDKTDPDKDVVVKPDEPKEIEEPPKGPSKAPGAILLGVGIAALGGGGYFGLQASNTQDTFNAAQDAAGKRDAQTQGIRQARIADGLYAGGAVFSAIGVVLLVRASKKSEATELEHTEEAPASNVTWAPTFGKGFGGFSMGLTF